MIWPKCPIYTNGRIFLAVVPLDDATYHLVSYGRTWAKKGGVQTLRLFLQKMRPGAEYLTIRRGRHDRFWDFTDAGTMAACSLRIPVSFRQAGLLDLGAVLDDFANRNRVLEAPPQRDRRQRKLF